MTKEKKYTYVRFTSEELEYIGNHSADTRVHKLAEYFGCTDKAIHDQIKKNGFVKHKRLRHDKESAEEFMRLFNSEIPRCVIADKYGMLARTVTTTAWLLSRKFGIPRLKHDRSGKIVNKKI